MACIAMANCLKQVIKLLHNVFCEPILMMIIVTINILLVKQLLNFVVCLHVNR